MNETKFCRLCGKNKPVEEFVPVGLCRLPSGAIFIVDVCKGCNIVIHNIRTMVGEAERKDMDRLREETKKAGETDRLITVPRIKVPINLRN